ncbi:hypothetical protein MMC18_000491 [Xylographa bjoerkii]|nr:hypothetical protein [Xylographa bjoerkii]
MELLSLESLNHDVLKQIINFLTPSGFGTFDVPPDPNDSQVSKNAMKTLQAFAATNKLFRGLAVPSLFHIVAIKGRQENALNSRVQEMEKCPDVVSFFRTFKFINPGGDDEKYLPHDRLASNLSRLFNFMERLTKLVIDMPKNHIGPFTEVFQKDGVVLPLVETLVVGPFCEFAVTMCPNVKFISVNSWRWMRATGGDDQAQEPTLQLINAAKTAPRLIHLEVYRAWTATLVEGTSRIIQTFVFGYC